MDIGFWLAVTIVLSVVEAATVNLVSVWFVLGALGAAVTAFLGGPFWLQLVVFAAVSLLLLLALRPFVKRFVNPRKQRTNVDALIGQRALVTEQIDNLRGSGAIQINGNVWTARALRDELQLAPDTVVRIRRIEGVKAIVEPDASSETSNTTN